MHDTPPKKKNPNKLNFINIKNFCSRLHHYGGYKALCVCQNPQNYVSQTVNFHV